MIDAAKVLGEIVALLGGLGGFLGVFGVAMMVVTLLLLSVINVLSPLAPRANFLLATIIVSLAALYQGIEGSDLAVISAKLLPYWVVMLAPLFAATAISLLMRRGRSDEATHLGRIEQLTDELRREIDALKRYR